MNKKKLLSLLLAVVMIFSLCIPALADDAVPADAKGTIVILHSNDVHGALEGYAKMAALKAAYEKAGAQVYVMDAGDYISGSTSVSISEGATAIELMNMVGYDVAAPGNHEFDFGYANLQELEKTAKFPILAANVSYNGKAALGTATTFTAEDGTKIGVFGLDTPETATKAHPAKIKGVTFLGGEEMYKCAQTQIDALKADKCDVIICLGHLGIDDESKANNNRSVDLLEKVTGIDVLVDGHSHSTEEKIAELTGEDRTVNGTIVTSTGTQFANIGVITIKDGKVVSADCVAADKITVADDDPILVRAKEIADEIEAEYGATFAESKVLLLGEARDPGVRTQETNMGDLACDAILWYATKDDLGVPTENVVAITNGGGIRKDIAAGDVSKNNVKAVLPYGNTVSVVYVTGEALLESLEASTFCTPTAVGAFPQIAGMNITIDTTKEYDKGDLYPGTTYNGPKSIQRVTINDVNGKPFDAKATYAVVTNDFLASGGDTYYTMSTSEKITDTGVPMDEALMAYITEKLEGVIPENYAEPAGRITIKTPRFSDVPQWAMQAVEWAVDKDITNGISATTFGPSTKCTDQMILTFIQRQQNGGVKDGDYDGAVAWGEEQKLVEAGTVDNKSECTRAKVVTYLWKLAGSPEATLTEGQFKDVAVDADSAVAVAWAVKNQITNGDGGEDIFNPDGVCTRAQIVTFLMRYANIGK